MIRWGSFESPEDAIYKEIEMLRVYEMALRTWSDWVEVHVNRAKTQLFFVSMSPTHERYVWYILSPTLVPRPSLSCVCLYIILDLDVYLLARVSRIMQIDGLIT